MQRPGGYPTPTAASPGGVLRGAQAPLPRGERLLWRRGGGHRTIVVPVLHLRCPHLYHTHTLAPTVSLPSPGASPGARVNRMGEKTHDGDHFDPLCRSFDGRPQTERPEVIPPCERGWNVGWRGRVLIPSTGPPHRRTEKSPPMRRDRHCYSAVDPANRVPLGSHAPPLFPRVDCLHPPPPPPHSDSRLTTAHLQGLALHSMSGAASLRGWGGGSHWHRPSHPYRIGRDQRGVGVNGESAVNLF